MKTADRNGSLELIRRLFKEHIHLQTKNMAIAMGCMFVIAVCTGLSAFLMKPVLDEIFVHKKADMLLPISIAIVVNGIIKGIAHFFQSAKMKVIGQSIVSDMQLRLYQHLIYADMKFLMNHPSGNLISRFTNDISAMRESTSNVLTGMIMDFCTLIGLIGLMFYHSPSLSLIMLLVLPASIYPIRRLGHRMRKIARGIQEELSCFTVHLDETFQNVRIIKSYCREQYEIHRAKSVINRFTSLLQKAAYIESSSSPITETLATVAIAVVIAYGGAQVCEDITTPGAFFSFITALLMAYKPLKGISQLNTSLQEGLSAAKRLFTILDAEVTIKDRKDCSRVAFSNYNIVFHSVGFAYKDEYLILDDFNILIPQGKTVALVGTSGSGKSTVFNLLQRFYDPDTGHITIGGENIVKIRLRDLRGSIALVSQEIALFDDTVGENIRYGKLGASKSELIDAAIAAAAHDFIINLPQGYDTQIGQHGAKLSGGQRQRIAIARAILKNAPILLLDEATSALDSISEKHVQAALENLKKGRTTIVIAHRLSTIETADLICFMEDGRLVESGSHAELMEQNGAYCELYTLYKNEKLSF